MYSKSARYFLYSFCQVEPFGHDGLSFPHMKRIIWGSFII